MKNILQEGMEIVTYTKKRDGSKRRFVFRMTDDDWGNVPCWVETKCWSATSQPKEKVVGETMETVENGQSTDAVVNANPDAMNGYISLKDCIESGKHLQNCDNDGYCYNCGIEALDGEIEEKDEEEKKTK